MSAKPLKRARCNEGTLWVKIDRVSGFQFPASSPSILKIGAQKGLFAREWQEGKGKHTATYLVSLSLDRVRELFEQYRYPTLPEKIFSLDRDLLNIAWAQLMVSHARFCIGLVVRIPPLKDCIWSYICNQTGLHYFGTCTVLQCERHTFDADYLHQEYSIVDSNLHESILTRAAYFHKVSASCDKLSTLRDELKRNRDVLSKEKEELKHKIDVYSTLLSTVRRASRTESMKAYVNTVLYRSFLEPAWIKVEWRYQSCEHPWDHRVTCHSKGDCWSACNPALVARLNEVGSFSVPTPFSISFDSQDYSLTWVNSNELVQTNVSTKRRRWVIKSTIYDISRTLLPAHVASIAQVQKIVDMIGSAWNDEKVWLSDAQSEGAIQELFMASSTETGESMRSWAAKNRKILNVTSMQWIHYPLVAESFLVNRAHLSSSLCLLGFHGTSHTSPHTVIQGGGPDPRYSSTSQTLYLGQASYFSQSAHYCHTKGYAHKTEEGSYQLLVICFCPGRAYHEPNPASSVATARRIPPPDADSVTCITQDTRVWAVYERALAYPLILLTYTVTEMT